MLSDRISTLFDLLGCNNSDIARALDCSPSNISRIHSGGRSYKPKDRSVLRLAEGVYIYADKLNMLPSLCGLCRVNGENRETVIPALIAWIFDTDEASLPEIKLSTGHKTTREIIREQNSRSFGERLNDVMELLDMSNMRLARQINVDASHISRFRSGVRSPKPNTEISGLVSAALIKRATEQNRIAELSKLTLVPAELLSDEVECITAFSAWLYDVSGEPDISDIDRLLDCIDSFSPDSKIPLLELSSFVTDSVLNSGKTEYWGIDGLREAVIRFLGNTVKQGGELWLYSDEDIGWMVGDKAFFAKWYALILACVKRGVKVRIIHNLDRETDEMISAIQSWMPLYMSGMIEAYVCRRGRDTRFSHTVFLRPSGECVYANHIKGTEANGWYEFLTDDRKLAVLATEYDKLLGQCEPLVKIHIGTGDKLFTEEQSVGSISSMLSGLSLGTMPEKLVKSLLERNGITGDEANRIKGFCRIQRKALEAALTSGNVCEFTLLPPDDELFGRGVRVNLSPSLYNTDIYYTPEEYACHISAISTRLDESTSYHFYVLPELPFTDIQIIKSDDRVTVIRAKQPYAAFVFTEPMMLHAFDGYFEVLKKRYKCDRSDVRRSLRKLI